MPSPLWSLEFHRKCCRFPMLKYISKPDEVLSRHGRGRCNTQPQNQEGHHLHCSVAKCRAGGMGETNNQTPNREAKLQSGRSALSCNHIGWNGRRPLTNTTRTSSTSTPATLVVRCCSMRASQPAPPCSRGQAQVGHISRGQRTARPTQLHGKTIYQYIVNTCRG